LQRPAYLQVERRRQNAETAATRSTCPLVKNSGHGMDCRWLPVVPEAWQERFLGTVPK